MDIVADNQEAVDFLVYLVYLKALVDSALRLQISGSAVKEREEEAWLFAGVLPVDLVLVQNGRDNLDVGGRLR